jgi:hypothetical protein
MKRIKLDQNRFLAFYQTFTDRGQTIGFEICRRPNSGNPVPLIAYFKSDQANEAQIAFQKLSLAMEMRGPRMSRQLRDQILTGQSSHNIPMFGGLAQKIRLGLCDRKSESWHETC